MAPPKGKPRPPNAGRKKGSVNKVTADIRQMISNALDKAGGVNYLLQQARENPASFLSLVAKIVPQKVDIGGQKDNPIIISTPLEAKRKWLEMREHYDKRTPLIEAKPCEPQPLH